MKNDELDKNPTLELPHISLKDTVKIQQLAISTAELPAIPKKLVTKDVAEQARLILEALAKDSLDEFEIEQKKAMEMVLRRRILVQLEKVMVFLDKILQAYRAGFPSLPEQISIYNNSISANINSLENTSISTKDVVVKIHRIMMPIIEELNLQFSKDQDEYFSFAVVKSEIRECLGKLASIIQESSK